MEFTGERYVPEVHGNIEIEHIHRYLLACEAVVGKVVLDLASGEGYGSAMLARTARKVTGVDVSQEAISHAREKYQSENLDFRLGSCSAIPLEDASIDVVVSFETIEHHSEHQAMMREIKRVLRPGGALIISSPDKLEYSDKPGYSNPHHVKELYRDEFCKLVSSYFKNHRIFGQRVVYGSAIFGEDSSIPVHSYNLADNTLSPIRGVPHAVYLVAVASDVEVPLIGSGLLEQQIEGSDVVQGQIVSFNQAVSQDNDQLASLRQVVMERDRQLENLNQTVSERDKQIAERDGEIASSKQSLVDLTSELRGLQNQLTVTLRSNSWRITIPLREIRRWVDMPMAQFKRYVKAAFRQIGRAHV